MKIGIHELKYFHCLSLPCVNLQKFSIANTSFDWSSNICICIYLFISGLTMKFDMNRNFIWAIPVFIKKPFLLKARLNMSGTLFGKVAFYPTLYFNMLMSKVSSRAWYNRIDETVVLGALPLQQFCKQVTYCCGIASCGAFH